jgi:hypothetical protein
MFELDQNWNIKAEGFDAERGLPDLFLVKPRTLRIKTQRR